jgi:hypothetical protein
MTAFTIPALAADVITDMINVQFAAIAALIVQVPHDDEAEYGAIASVWHLLDGIQDSIVEMIPAQRG